MTPLSRRACSVLSRNGRLNVTESDGGSTSHFESRYDTNVESLNDA